MCWSHSTSGDEKTAWSFAFWRRGPLPRYHIPDFSVGFRAKRTQLMSRLIQQFLYRDTFVGVRVQAKDDDPVDIVKRRRSEAYVSRRRDRLY